MNSIKLRAQALLRNKRLMHILKIVFPITVIVFVIFQGQKELAHFSIKKSLHAIRLLSGDYFTGLIVAGGLAVSCMYFYDVLLLRSIRVPFRWGKVFRVSWIANTFNGIFGFGGIAGVGVRTILYRESAGEVGRLLLAIAWMAPSMISGLSILGILVMFGVFPAFNLLAVKGWLWITLIGVALFFPAYILFSQWKGRRHANAKITLGYTIVSFAEWLAAGSVAYLILYLLGSDVTYPEVIGVFTVSAIAGLISMVPGGFGTFDITYLIGLQAIGVADSTVFTALLLYRIVYYFIPFALGLIFAAFEFGGVAVKRFEDHPTIGSYIETGSIIWFIQRSLWNSLSSWSVVILMFMTSLFLSLYTLTVPEWERSAFLLPLIYGDHGDFYPLVNGIVLGASILMMLMLKGLFERTIRAYFVTLLSLGLCTVLTFLLGTTIRHTLWLAGMILVLVMLRSQFNRYRYPLTKGTIIVTGILMTLFLLSYALVGYLLGEIHLEPAYASVTLSYAQFTTTLLTGLVTALLLYSISYVAFERHLREPLGRAWIPEDDALLQGPNGWLYRRLPGKRVFHAITGKLPLPFLVRNRRAILFGCPPSRRHPEAMQLSLTELYEQADRYGLDIVFLQAGVEEMPMLHDFGNDFFKMGESARLDIPAGRISLPHAQHELLPLPLDAQRLRELTHVVQHQYQAVPHGYLASLRRLLSTEDPDLRLLLLHGEPDRCIGYAVYRIHPAGKAMIVEDIRIRFSLARPEHEEPLAQLRELLLRQGQRHHCDRLVSGLVPLSHVETNRAPRLWSERAATAIFRRVRDLYPLSQQRSLWEAFGPVVWEPQYIAFLKQRQMNWTIWRLARSLSQVRKGTRGGRT
ncbi:MAG: flippase-like domain-containing protein [Paenibacillus dendritiformis]|uniref:flippase-like domain-containing protein n=1 Tax=Paenibacillus dendritiformis TaxID=130049 RepID=UPI00143DEDD3|nr:flippase-like domain-containing protein [Paenibacillus dendritiformis]MDU5144455.1 flippase-like domain-containing protein [Paenibacillus dendritiformis]NKI22242.1 lysylphosphatidylglycerol synthetase family protein [Paenibacillus dendritiformis]NRG00694.1 lysylphosphatidylglycerol synthetase family protein [Paenibacillus dendritiformis]